MNYKNVIEGIFLSRPNRFIAKVAINGKEETVHVKNTGRCRELLIKGSKVYLSVSDNPERKTKYDLISVIKEKENGNSIFVNMDSQIPNDVVEEWLKAGKLFSPSAEIRREVKKGDSRFDFYVCDRERKAFIEVKGVTLENDGIALFPDAPTVRGIKHINELIACKEEGFEAYIIFVIQMKGVKLFTPNTLMQAEFTAALKRAKKCGVNILAYDSIVTENSIALDKEITIEV